MTKIYTMKDVKLTFPSLTGRIPRPPEPQRFEANLKLSPESSMKLREMLSGMDFSWLERRAQLHYDMESIDFNGLGSVPTSVWSSCGFYMDLSTSLTKAPSLELWRSGRGKSTSWNDQQALQSFLTAISGLRGSPQWIARWKKYSAWTLDILRAPGETITTSTARLKDTTALKTSLPQVVSHRSAYLIATLRRKQRGSIFFDNRKFEMSDGRRLVLDAYDRIETTFRMAADVLAQDHAMQALFSLNKHLGVPYRGKA